MKGQAQHDQVGETDEVVYDGHGVECRPATAAAVAEQAPIQPVVGLRGGAARVCGNSAIGGRVEVQRLCETPFCCHSCHRPR